MTATILPAAGSTFSVDGLFTLTIEPRCNSTQRRREWIKTTAGEVEYSECRAHRGGRRAEPMAADDYPPIR